ncbi:hypothetical protein ACNKHW_02215 [Shigella flexneri]
MVWLFTWPGVPCISHGDEVGLDGKNDPFCRKTFPWQVESRIRRYCAVPANDCAA